MWPLYIVTDLNPCKNPMMAYINIENLCLTIGNKELFNNLNITLQDGDKITLVADNGAGKSTLMRIIACRGEIPGSETIPTGINVRDFINVKGEIGCLPQSFEGFADLLTIDHLILASKRADLIEWLELPERSDEWFRELNGLGAKNLLKTFAKLGLKEEYLKRSFFDLSSGERVKVYLAGLLNSDVDIVIFDEPTNHLDITGCDMVEKFIKHHRGITLMVTHDRALVNNTGSQIYEICPIQHSLIGFKGGYQGYLEQQAEMRVRAENERRKQKKQLDDMRKLKSRLGVDDRAPQALKAKQKIEDLKANMTQIPSKRNEPRMEFNSTEKTASYARVTATKLVKHPLFKDVSFDLRGGDRMVIVGPNGTGKTTLIEILMRMQEADKGGKYISPGAKIGFLDQESKQLDLSLTPVELMVATSKDINSISAAVVHLKKFGLYYEHDFFSKLADLSIGCRKKTHLAQIMLTGCDVLFLDEPTNHLYFNAIEQIEEQLLDFPGIVVAISHDRYFINKIATRVLKLDSDEYRINPVT